MDTHAKTHTYAVIDPKGQSLGCEQFPTTAKGITRAIAWVGRRTRGQAEALWVIEGVATYGAGLAHAAAEAGYEVAEAPRMNAKIHHGVGKSDAIDAQAIATAALALDQARLRRPRADQGVRQALRVLVASCDQMTQEKTMNVNALTALLRVQDLGIDAPKPLTAAQIGEASRWRGRDESLAQAVARDEAVRLARRVLTLEEALTANHARMAELITDSPAAALLEEKGIGAYTAAVVITAWSHPGRIRDEAAFASLAGVNPIPASSGNTILARNANPADPVVDRVNRSSSTRSSSANPNAGATRPTMTHDPTQP